MSCRPLRRSARSGPVDIPVPGAAVVPESVPILVNRELFEDTWPSRRDLPDANHAFAHLGLAAGLSALASISVGSVRSEGTKKWTLVVKTPEVVSQRLTHFFPPLLRACLSSRSSRTNSFFFLCRYSIHLLSDHSHPL